MIAVLLETMFQVKEMIKANDLKHIDVCYFYVFFFVCFQRMSTYISSFSAMVFGMHLLWKTNGYFFSIFQMEQFGRSYWLIKILRFHLMGGK